MKNIQHQPQRLAVRRSLNLACHSFIINEEQYCKADEEMGAAQLDIRRALTLTDRISATISFCKALYRRHRAYKNMKSAFKTASKLLKQMET